MKLGGWVVMLLSMITFLTLLGIPPAGVGGILEKFGVGIDVDAQDINADVENSTFWTWAIGALTLLGVGGTILIGLFGKGYDPSLIYAPIIVLIAGLFISSFWAVISMVASYHQFWMTSIVTLIFVGLGGGFIMSCLDYFGGR